MRIERIAKDTLTPFELNVGDELAFTLVSGERRKIRLLATHAEIIDTDLDEVGVPQDGRFLNYRFSCRLEIDGQDVRIEREASTQKSFCEPLEIAGMTLWLDAVDDIFDFLQENHGPCRPGKQARFAVQDATLPICPEKIHPWCPLPEGGLKIEDCYNGEDVWMGAYFGADAHGGLDINHPAGTPLFAPIDIDDHWLRNSVAAGHNNNRWHGERRWANGSIWILDSCHMIRLTVEEHTPLKAGQTYAEGAGVWVGSHEHSHFAFRILEHGQEILLDPWILFRAMYQG